MHIWMKYKLDFEKYRKSDVEKYKNKILQSERADLIEMSPDLDFCMKRLDVKIIQVARSGDQIWK